MLEAGAKLRVVGRAGVGVDNVDVETATRRGVIVMNAPGGNTVSTAEHAFSLLLCAARKLPQADAMVRSGKWSRKEFQGVELYNKSLGIIGMGRIGSELSRRAIAFGMRVLAFDPYLSATRARSLQVELVDELDDLLREADFITLHTPLTPETHHLLNAERFAKMKRGVRIINCARGGLIDEAALAECLTSGHVAGAALDVFEKEPLPDDSPLRGLPNLVLTPHLGASTAEAQESVGHRNRAIDSRRAPRRHHSQRREHAEPRCENARHHRAASAFRRKARPFPFAARAEPRRSPQHQLQRQSQRSRYDRDHALGAERLSAKSRRQRGERSERAGLRREPRIANQRDALERAGRLHRSARASVAPEGKSVSVAGAFFGATPRIVSINSRPVEARPHGVILVLENTDRPGIVGRIGTLLGDHGVNIATMSLSRNEAGGTALTVLNLDTAPNDDLLGKIRGSEDIRSAQVIQL